ncbi:hypothetical protein SDC9_157411 [bioreactor metagenome]|uniref:Uncharacterized protein n=1 Tax=bioreactor metagenome TaxID=1076179 RepID=A0A645F6W3_9ZZZZ
MQIWVVDAHPVAGSQARDGGNHQRLSFCKRVGRFFQLSETNLRSLQIHQDGNRNAQLPAGLAHKVMTHLLLFMTAMAEVETNDPAPCFENGLDHRIGAACRPECSHNFCVVHTLPPTPIIVDGQPFVKHANRTKNSALTRKGEPICSERAIANLTEPDTVMIWDTK